MLVIPEFLREKENLRKFLPVFIILIALPLIVLLSFQQQELRQNAATTPDCNYGLTCGACSATANTCSYGNGTESCTYTTSLDGASCNPKTFSQVFCHTSNCSSGFTCSSSQQCIASSGPTATPTPPSTTIPPFQGGSGIWVSQADIDALPTSGSAWTSLKSAADGSLGSAAISNQDSNHDVLTLAVALAYAKTKDASYRAKAASAIMSAIGTEKGGRALALGRNLVAYVIAADLIDLKSYSASNDQTFRSWLSSVRSESMTGGPSSLINCDEVRPNNWGMHCGASRAAADVYLGDKTDLAKTATVFKGWLGDRSSYSGFSWGDLSWQCNSSTPVGINPQGCAKSGHSIDGVLPDDQRRAGGFTWPPQKENYVYEALQGASVQAVILYRQGYDVFSFQNKALLRAYTWLNDVDAFAATGDDSWQPWLINHYYHSNFPKSGAGYGKNMGFTDWTFPN